MQNKFHFLLPFILLKISSIINSNNLEYIDSYFFFHSRSLFVQSNLSVLHLLFSSFFQLLKFFQSSCYVILQKNVVFFMPLIQHNSLEKEHTNETKTKPNV
jgi:hypothetical protein